MNTPSYPAVPEQIPPAEPVQADLGEDAYESYLGRSPAAARYSEQFHGWDQTGHSSVSWNWAAFLVGGCWLAYRRMFVGALLYLAATLVFDLTIDIFLPPLLARLVGLVVPPVCLALLANHLLYLNVKAKTGGRPGDPGLRGPHYLPAASPTSWPAVFGFLVIAVVVVGMFTGIESELTPAGQFSKAVSYLNGKGVARDDSKAASYFLRAASAGFAPAQYSLGVMYMKGRGVPQDDGKAVTWYRKAAEQGYAMAQSNLGVLYAKGQGVPRDDSLAVAWYRKAAEQRYAMAEYNLGLMYENGRGVPQDHEQALTWVRKAAEQNFLPAQQALHNAKQ